MALIDTTGWDRADWLAWRRNGLGGSDAPVFAFDKSLVGYSSPTAVYLDKLGLLPDDDEDTPEAVKLGHDYELMLKSVFERRNPGLHLVHPQSCWEYDEWSIARCTVDYLVAESPDATPAECVGVLECKLYRGKYTPGEPPAHFVVQVAWQKFVVGVERAWVAVGHGRGQVDIVEVHPDIDDWEHLLARALEFWTGNVVPQIPPAVDDSDATDEALKVAYASEVKGKTVDLDQLGHLLGMRDALAASESVLKHVNNAIRSTMADAEFGMVDGDLQFVCRTQAGRTITCPSCGHKTGGRPTRVLRKATKTDKEKISGSHS